MPETAKKPPARRPDSQQLARQWSLLRLLSTSKRAWSVKELAEQLGSNKSTIRRDLDTLEHEFALIEEQVGKQKRTYRIDETVRALEAIQFGTMELLSLHAARSALEPLMGTPFYDDLRKVLEKIRGFLSERQNGSLDAMARVFLPHVRSQIDYSGQVELIDELVDAIARRRVCKLVYYAAWTRKETRFSVRPLRLLWHRSALYLMACLMQRAELRSLPIHRIRSLEVLDETFTPPRVDLEGHTRRAFGIFVSDQEEDVEILFEREIAWKVEERTYHPDEKKERLPDRRLRYSIRSSAQWEIIPWVQSFGPLAELVKPESWRAILVENARATMAKYE